MKRTGLQWAFAELAARAHEEEQWQTIAFMLRMAEIALYRKKSLCVRWRRPLRRHGDRRYKAALRIVQAEWRRQIAEAPEKWRGAVLTGVKIA